MQIGYEASHDYNYANPVKETIDICKYRYSYVCTICHETGYPSNYDSIEYHKNATYRYLDYDNSEYIYLKYGINAQSSYIYSEVTCPLCKETALYEFSNSIYLSHLYENEPAKARYKYTLKDGNVIKNYDVFVDIPHQADDHGICNYCGKRGTLVIKVTEGVKVALSYAVASDNATLNSIIFDRAGFDYANNKIETLSDGNRKTTYYADSAMTKVICSFVTTNMYGQYIQILDGSDNPVYEARAGEPLPEYRFE